jgi:hypothetical protein
MNVWNKELVERLNELVPGLKSLMPIDEALSLIINRIETADAVFKAMVDDEDLSGDKAWGLADWYLREGLKTKINRRSKQWKKQ